MTLLSIYMPSNRSLDASRDAILSALAYADHVDAKLIVSDNSGDADKRRWLEGRFPRLHYIASTAESYADNWRAAFSTVDTPFLLPMGDDDLISFQEQERPVVLSDVPADVAAIRPNTQIWTLKDGVRTTDRFTIEAATAADRLREYRDKASGNNAIYYSIFRSNLFLPLMQLFVESHPTRGGYTDWAICLGVFSAGRVIHDPSWTYRYDLGRWARSDTLAKAKEKLYLDAELPADTGKFWGLLLFLDLHVFMTRLRMDGAQRQEAYLTSQRIFLAPFLKDVIANPDSYDETVRYIVDMIAQEQQPDTVLQLAIYLTDCIKPGLKDGYVRFFQAANAA